MNKAMYAVVIMCLSSFAGLWITGIFFNDLASGVIAGAIISGIACLIYTIETKNNE